MTWNNPSPLSNAAEGWRHDVNLCYANRWTKEVEALLARVARTVP